MTYVEVTEIVLDPFQAAWDENKEPEKVLLTRSQFEVLNSGYLERVCSALPTIDRSIEMETWCGVRIEVVEEPVMPASIRLYGGGPFTRVYTVAEMLGPWR